MINMNRRGWGSKPTVKAARGVRTWNSMAKLNCRILGLAYTPHNHTSCYSEEEEFQISTPI